MNNTIKDLEKECLNKYLAYSKTIIMPTDKNKNKDLNNIDDSNKKEDEELVKNVISIFKKKKGKYESKMNENENSEIIDENKNIDFKDNKSSYSYLKSSKKNEEDNNTKEIYKSNSKNSKIINESQTEEKNINDYSFNCLTNDLDFIVTK